MKLIDLLEITNENTIIKVFAEDEFTFYDGKNSIEDCFNNNEINEIKVVRNELWVDLEVE